MGAKLKPGINDLYTVNPGLANEWHPVKNGALTPDQVCVYSGKKVWWKIETERFGKCFTLEWDAVISNRSLGAGCPFTSKPPKKMLTGFNDFQTMNPRAAALWHRSKNKAITPDMIFEHTDAKYWWSHEVFKNGVKFLHEWEACPKNVLENSCPYCQGRIVMAGFNDLASTYPEVAEQWDSEKNGTCTPKDVSAGCNDYAFWICNVCGHKWSAVINNRTRGSGCPKCAERCSTSYPEQALYYYIRQVFPTCVNRDTDTLGGLELDLYLPEQQIGIEYNGLWSHSNKRSKDADKRKIELCREKGILLIRVCESKSASRYYRKKHLIVCKADGKYTYLVYVMKCLCMELKAAGYLEIPIQIHMERDRQEIYAQYYETVKDRSLGEKYPDLLEEWDYEENGVLSPYSVFAHGSTKICWKHSVIKDGIVFVHKWKSAASKRTALGRGCPICSGKIVQAGFNDLKAAAPDLSAQWDYEKNRINPDEITANSHKMAAWKHTVICSGERISHTWMASVKSRMQGNGCPVCDGKIIQAGFNDLATTNPELLSEWDYGKNHQTPAQISYGYDQKVWWKHEIEKNGKIFLHSWSASPNSRTNRKSGCPYCANKKVLKGYNDLESSFPRIAQKWDQEKNAPATPDQFTAASSKKAWWTDRKKPVSISDRTKYIRG